MGFLWWFSFLLFLKITKRLESWIDGGGLTSCTIDHFPGLILNA